MSRKFKFNNLMSLVLAASAVAAIIIACGSGDIIEIKDEQLAVSLNQLAMQNSSDSAGNPSSPSGGGDSSDSDGGDSSGSVDGSSGSVDGSSDSVDGSSSSEDAPSSSSTPPPPIICEFEHDTYMIGEEVKLKTLRCDDGSPLTSVTFTAAGGYLSATGADNWKTGGSATYATKGNSSYGVGGLCGDFDEASMGICQPNPLEITDAPTARCEFATHTYEVGDAVTLTPNITCSGGFTATGGTLEYVSGGDLVDGKYTTSGTRKYKITGVLCGGAPVEAASCTDIEVKNPAITCNWTPNTYRGGELVPAPIIACVSSGKAMSKTGATFTKVSGIDAETPANWANENGTTKYGLRTTQSASSYKVSGVTCDGYEAAETTCNALTITVSPTATCKFERSGSYPDSYITGDPVVPPTITCSGGFTPTGTTTIIYTSGVDVLTTSGVDVLTAASLTSKATGNGVYTVKGVICDNIRVADAPCNNIAIKPIPTATCTWATKTYNIGATVPAPTIGCLAGDGYSYTRDVTLAQVTNKSGLSAVGAFPSYYSASGTSTYEVSGIKCDGYATATKECDVLTINPVTCTVAGDYDIGESFNVTLTNCEGKSSASTSLPSAGPNQPVTLTSVTCGTHNVPVTNIACTGNVTINPEPTCDAYGGNGNTNTNICNGVPWREVKWNEKPQRTTGGGNQYVPTGCYWVQSWSGTNDKGFGNISNYFINGVSYSNNSNKQDWDENKIDGGIYIYIPTNTSGDANNTSTITTGSKPPYCTGKSNAIVPTLECKLGTMTGAENKPIDISSKLKCTDGTTPKGPFTLGSIDLEHPTATLGQLQNLQASAICGGTSSILRVNATCTGTLEVLDASQACEAQRDMSTYCPNTNWADVYWNDAPAKPVNFSVGNRIPAGCFWVKSWNTGFSSNFGSNNTIYTFRLLERQLSHREALRIQLTAQPQIISRPLDW